MPQSPMMLSGEVQQQTNFLMSHGGNGKHVIVGMMRKCLKRNKKKRHQTLNGG